MYLVTGTSSGIGLEIAKYLVSQGAMVVGVSRRQSPLEHERFRSLSGDVSDPKLRNQIVSALGGQLDGVVFNAGVLEAVTTLAAADADAWRQVFDINLFSIVGMLPDLIPLLRKSHGRAIFVSSGASTSAYQAWGAYGASKAALNHLSMTLAKEEPDIISVAVAPGVVGTEMQKRIRETYAASGHMKKEEAEKFHSLHQNKQLVNPEDSGRLYGNLVMKASADLSGKYLRYYSDELLKPYN